MKNTSRSIVQEQLSIEYVSIDRLRSTEVNPRFWGDEATKQLRESISRFGMVDGLIANKAPGREGVIIGGHFRLEVAKQLGLKRVPVIWINIPDIKRERELNLRLNANQGTWDPELLKDFDPTLIITVGLADELTKFWDQQLATDEDDFNEERAVKEVKQPITKTGDLIKLGNHFLLCGDSTDQKVVARLMNGVKADMLYCDPPFNIGLDYDGGLGGKKSYGGHVDDKKSDADYRQFLVDALTAVTPHMKPDHHAFIWCDQNYIGLVQSILAESGRRPQRVCLWIKQNSNPTPQVAFNKCYEPVVYAVAGKPYLSTVHNLNEVLNREVGSGVRTLDDIADLLDIWLVKRLPTTTYQHATQKPSTLHEKPLRRCTRPGDVVVDLYGGSGSSLISCEQLKRRAFLVEKEPVFCDVIIRRFEELTGQHAVYCR